MSPGAAGLRLGLGFVVCGPRSHVIRLRPGRPTVRTLEAPVCCADAPSPSGFVGVAFLGVELCWGGSLSGFASRALTGSDIIVQ